MEAVIFVAGVAAFSFVVGLSAVFLVGLIRHAYRAAVFVKRCNDVSGGVPLKAKGLSVKVRFYWSVFKHYPDSIIFKNGGRAIWPGREFIYDEEDTPNE